MVLGQGRWADHPSSEHAPPRPRLASCQTQTSHAFDKHVSKLENIPKSLLFGWALPGHEEVGRLGEEQAGGVGGAGVSGAVK